MSNLDLSTLNDAQRSIATTLDAPLFVQAGAGSGKTFTLTRRVVWALSEGSGADGRPFLNDLSQVLVITFTNAAAREIKERVRATLRSVGMRDAALRVDSAWISTIHGMCQRILKRNALELGLDPHFGVCGTHRQEELLDVAVERAVGAARRNAKRESLTARAFKEFEYTGVVTRVLALVKHARTARDGFNSLQVVQAGGAKVVAEAMEDLTRVYEALGSVKRLSPSAQKIVFPALDALHAFGELPPTQRTAESAATALQKCKAPRFSKAIADLHGEAKAELAHAKALVELERVAEYAPVLIDLALRTEECYAQIKRSLALLDNDDLITLALDAVRSEPVVQARYTGRFRLVMVDEFQDTDSKQLELISLLAGGGALELEPQHLATVGDAQQSIYRFRGADVAVFNARGERVPAAGHVRLDTNYRSHADILAFVDAVCGGQHGVLDDFMHLDACPTRKDEYAARELPRVAVEITTNGQTGISTTLRTVQMANQVAQRLVQYRNAGEAAGGMALLLGSTTHADLYIDALRAHGLECVVTGGSTFTKAPEVGVMLSLLRTLANPHDTQSGLFPLLSSEMFELDANDFLQLGTRTQTKLDAPTKRTIDRGIAEFTFFENATPSARLSHARAVLVDALESLATRPIADVCLDVVRNSGWLSRLEAQGPAGMAREANVLAAVRYIRDLTSEMGLGPVRAAAEFAQWLEVSKVPPASLAGDEQDTVRVMTIHASKGLEYPVVAVAECWNNVRLEGGLLAQKSVDGNVRAVVLSKERVAWDGANDACRSGDIVDIACTMRETTKAADAQEKARLLYVALTRAREALVLAMNLSVSKENGISSELGAGVVRALFGDDEGLPPEGESCLRYGGSSAASVRYVAVRVDAESEDEGEESCDAPHVVGLYPAEEVGCDAVSLVQAREDVFSYSSALANAGGEAWAASQRPPTPRKEDREAEAAGEPATSDEDKATNLGSAFHMIAQTMVETGKQVSPERVEALARRWGLSARQRARLDEALAYWSTCDTRAEALGYGMLRAEVPFFMCVEDERYRQYGQYVEGAIDLLCTDGAACAGHALVVDYKTGDRGLSEDEIRARHQAQAQLYAHVLLAQGFDSVTCAFVCVEVGITIRYEF